MKARLFLVAIVAVTAGFIAGATSGLFIPDGHFARELQIEREKSAILTKLVEELQAERAEVRAVLEGGK